jgi:hypothetical protein
MSIMDDLSGKGVPVGQTYLEMWCRLFDECFLTLNRHEELAFHAGFSGQRAVRTWRDRVRRLRELEFIDVKSGPMGEFSYALFWNPYHVIRRHYEKGCVQEAKWRALVVRANEIGADDIDQNLTPAQQLRSFERAELDDEIPF